MMNGYRLYLRFVVYLALLAMSVAILPPPVARATTYTVTNLDDSGTGSLRQQIIEAIIDPADDIIEFSVSGTINLLTVLPVLGGSSTLTINGGGVITINRDSSAAQFRIFEIDPTATVALNGLTITNGSIASNGGAGIRNNGTLSLTNSTVRNNATTSRGGGIANAGTMTMTNTTVSNNSSVTNGGGGIAIVSGTMIVSNSTISNNSTTTGGGINVSVGTITLTNSTVNNNSATTSGGGLSISSGTAILINSTLTANSAPGTSGGGIRSAGGITNLRNTIVANSPTGTNCNLSSGTINAQNSLIEGALTCVNGTNTSNLTTPPNLGSLTGNPAYFPLNTGSPAIDAGNNTLTGGALLDQAGNTRIQGSAVDMGSVETNALPVVTISPSSTSIAEATNANFTVARTGATTADLIVTITVTLDSANMTDSDYDLSGGSISGQVGTVTVTIPASAPSVDVNFSALDDTPAEPDNSLVLALVDDAPYDLGTANSATATIPANDLAVTANTDDGEGSLRQAITNANAFSSDDTITFTTIGTIGLTAMLPVLANNGTLTINGGGVITVTRSSGTFNIFNVASGATVTLNGLTITNGDSFVTGGGISNNGNLTVNSSNIIDNDASGGGGGIANFGTLSVTDSTIANNNAAGGGGIFNGGGSTLSVTNTTLSDNSAVNEGGGVYNTGSLTITGSFILGNSAVSGDGVYTTIAGSVTNSCIVGNGDTAVFNASGVLTATGNWWGTSWGPNIPAAPSTSGSFVSSGDSINGTGQSTSNVNVGIVTIPAHYGDFDIAPSGNWLLTAPAGCATCTNVSGTGSPRVCIIPRP